MAWSASHCPVFVALAFLLAPRVADACSMEPDEGYQVSAIWADAIHADGVLAWHVRDQDGDASDVLARVRFDIEGSEGTLTAVPTGVASEAFVVWRPVGALQTGAYEARVTIPATSYQPEYSLTDPFEVLPASSGALQIGELAPELGASPFVDEEGARVCCTITEDVCGQGRELEFCQSQTRVQLAGLAYEVPIQGATQYAITRYFAGEYDDEPEVWARWSAVSPEPLPLPIQSEEEEYCVRIEVMDLRDESVTKLQSCVPHEPLQLWTEDNDLEAFVDSECGGSQAYWEESGEPFDRAQGQGKRI